MTRTRFLPIVLLVACYGEPSAKDPDTDTTPGDDTDTDLVPDSDDTTIDTDETDVAPPVTLDPPSVRILTLSPDTTAELAAEVTNPDPELSYAWSWTVDGVDAGIAAPTVPADRTTRGEDWQVTVTASNADGVSPPASATVTINNAAPTATVTLDPMVPTALVPIIATAAGEDADGDPLTWRYSWTFDNLPTAIPGAEVPVGTHRKGQTWRVTATPNDGFVDGAGAQASVVVGNSPPVVTAITINPAAPTTDSNLTTQVTRSDPDGDNLTLSYVWSRDGAPIPGATAATLGRDETTKGDVITVEVVARDGVVASAPFVSAPVVIGNLPPDFTGVSLGPLDADRAATLTCTPTGFFDPDNDPPGWQYAWYADGVQIPNASGPTLTGPAFAKDDSVTCEAAAFDGTATSIWLPSNAVRIRNTPPALLGVALNDYSPAQGESLTALPGPTADADEDTVLVEYQWYVNGAASGAGLTLPAIAYQAGDLVHVVATPFDGADRGPAQTSPSALVANTPPVATSLRLTPTSPDTNDAVFAVAVGTDADRHSLTWRYEWRVNGVVVPGQTTSGLDGAFFNKGQAITARAWPSDPYDEGEPIEASPVVVINSTPRVGGAAVQPGDARETSTLTCVGSGWQDDDGDPEAYRYLWYVNGIPSGTGATLTGAAFRRGDGVRCELTPDDGETTGSTVTSSTITIRNTPPEISRVRLSNLRPGTTESLTATIEGAFDADDTDVVGYRYSWRVDGVEVANTPVLSPPLTRNTRIVLRVTPTDGVSDGAPVDSDEAQVFNARPVLSAVRLTPDPATDDDDLRAHWTATDSDGDQLYADFRWFVNGAPILSVLTDTLPSTWHTIGDEVYANVFVTDGYELSEIRRTATVVINNRPPVLTEARIEPALAYEDTTLSCAPGPTSDPEGDAVSVFYAWRVNNNLIAESATLDGRLFDRDDTIVCIATPFDGTTYGAGVNTPPITIQNTPPVLASAALNTLTPDENSTLSVTLGATSDLDLDFVWIDIDWYVDGIWVGSTPTLDGDQFGRDDQVWAEVTPDDRTTPGTPVLTAPATVQNTPPLVTAAFIEPSAPTAFDTLRATATSRDIDGDGVTLAWTWLIDGVTVPGATTDTLAPPAFTSGDRIQVRVVPFDGQIEGIPYLSGQILVDNTPPTGTTAAISPTTVFEDTLVTCTGGGFSDPDGDPEGWTYRWKVDGALDASGPTINGNRFSRGDELRCVATPWDGTEPGPSIESAPVTVQNSPPTIGRVVLSRTEPVEGNTIAVIVEDADDPDNDPLTTTQVWYVNGAEVSRAAILDSSLFSKGDTIWATVEVSDGSLAATGTSNTITAVNSLPVLTLLDLSPDVPDTLADIVASVASVDADGDAVTPVVTWYVADVVDADVTGLVLTADRSSKNQTIRAVVTPWDGEAFGAPLSSEVLTVRNTPPTMTGITLAPTAISRNVPEVVCSAQGLADVDNDPLSVGFEWFVNGVLRSTSDRLLTFSLNRNDQVSCTARPYDNEAYGNGLQSPTLVMQNGAPTIEAVTLNTTTPREGDVLIPTVINARDPDGDVFTVLYSWRVNGVQVATTTLLDSNSFNRGNTVQLCVSANDLTVTGPAVCTGVLTVVNSPPVLTQAPSVSPGSPNRNSTLSTTATGNDPDGDPITWEYTWRVNGAVVQVSNSSTLAPGPFVKNNSVSVEIRGWDGLDWGATRGSVGVVIGNVLPPAPTLVITPRDPTPGVDNLVCTRTDVVDPDGDTVQYELRWRQGPITVGAAIRGPNTLTVPANLVGANENWQCDVRVNDGTGWGPFTNMVSIIPASLGQASCVDHRLRGSDADGVYALVTDGAEVPAWCDQRTLGGGWTRVMRTEGQELDWGQDTWEIVHETAPVDAAEGVYEAFDVVRNFQEVLIRQVSGRQAGHFAAYALVGDTGRLSLREVFESCRDEAFGGGDDARFGRPSVLGHTAWASAERFAGTLAVADPVTGQPAPARWLHVCGVSRTGDNDVSYLTFANATGVSNPWLYGWYGPAQPGTLWSFASGPYGYDAPSHLGGPGIVSFAGWKGAGTAAEAWHEGVYEVFVR